MKVTTEHVRMAGHLSGLTIPEEDLVDVAVRLSAMLTALEEFELLMADQIDVFEPIPPVYVPENSLVEFFDA